MCVCNKSQMGIFQQIAPDVLNKGLMGISSLLLQQHISMSYFSSHCASHQALFWAIKARSNICVISSTCPNHSILWATYTVNYLYLQHCNSTTTSFVLLMIEIQDWKDNNGIQQAGDRLGNPMSFIDTCYNFLYQWCSIYKENYIHSFSNTAKVATPNLFWSYYLWWV
jgi:hypothetical protein